MAAGEVFPSNHGGSTNAMKKKKEYGHSALHATSQQALFLASCLVSRVKRLLPVFAFRTLKLLILLMAFAQQ